MANITDVISDTMCVHERSEEKKTEFIEMNEETFLVDKKIVLWIKCVLN